MRQIYARRQSIRPTFFHQAEIDAAKVDAIEAYMRQGGTIPPVVVVAYGTGEFMPIDGHHRLSAAARIGCNVDAWVVPGSSFERLDGKCRDTGTGSRAEDFVMCGGVPALLVASRESGAAR